MRTSALRSPPRCRSTSATREVPGSAAATKTPTAWSASTSREEPTSRASPKRISMRLPCDSINVRERPWASKLRPINYKRCCTDRLNSQPASRTRHARLYWALTLVPHPHGIGEELRLAGRDRRRRFPADRRAEEPIDPARDGRPVAHEANALPAGLLKRHVLAAAQGPAGGAGRDVLQGVGGPQPVDRGRPGGRVHAFGAARLDELVEADGDFALRIGEEQPPGADIADAEAACVRHPTLVEGQAVYRRRGARYRRGKDPRVLRRGRHGSACSDQQAEDAAPAH